MNTSPAEPLPVLHASQLTDVPQVQRWLIESLWAKSAVGVIGGIPKVKKSWTGLELATAVGSGTKAFGHFAVLDPGPALIYLAEDALHVVKERLIHLAMARNKRLSDVDVRVITAPSLRLDIERERDRLVNTVRLHQPRLLLLDPFVRLHRIDENQAQEVAPLLDFLRQLSRTFGTAVIVVHHVRKSGAQKPGQALRGSGDIHAWGDSNLYLQPHKDGILMTVEQRSARAIEPIFLKLHDNPLHLAIEQAPTEQPLTLEQRIADALRGESTVLNRATLRETLKVNNLKLGQALTRLEQDGTLLRSEKGWSLRGQGGQDAPGDRPVSPPVNRTRGNPPPSVRPDAPRPNGPRPTTQLSLPELSTPRSAPATP